MSNLMTGNQRRALLAAVLGAIVDVVRATPDGAPGGVLYAYMNSRGMDLETFELVMGSLVSVGKLRKQGQLYYAVEQTVAQAQAVA